MRKKSFVLVYVAILGLAYSPSLIGQKGRSEWGPILTANQFTTAGEMSSAVPDSSITTISRYSYGKAWSVVVRNNHAYVGTSTAFLVLDISNGIKPELVGRLYVLGGVYDLALQHNLVYATGGGGLTIIDVSDPLAPREVGSVDIMDCTLLSVQRGYAYLPAPLQNGLRIVDITDPSSPRQVSFYKQLSAWDVQVSGDYAYVTDAARGFWVLDISNPVDPRELGWVTIEYPDAADLLSVSGSYAYISVHHSDRTTSRIEAVDISNPSRPRVVASCEASGRVAGIYASGGVVYLAIPQLGLQILDVSDPTNPKEIGRYDGAGYVGIYVSGNYAYIAAGLKGLRVLDVTDPAYPQEIGSYPIEGALVYQSVVALKNYAFLACGSDGLGIMDVSDPKNPRLVGFWDGRRPEGGYDTGFELGGIALYDHYAYVSDVSGSIYALDISDPSDPKKVGYYTLEDRWVRDPIVSGQYLYVIMFFRGLRILDISRPTSPIEVGSYNINGDWLNNNVEYLDVSGLPGQESYAYLVGRIDKQNCLLILDVSDPSHPKKVGEYVGTAKLNHIDVEGNYAYITMDDASFLIFDVSEKETPKLITNFPLQETDYIFGVRVADGYAYLYEAYHPRWGTLFRSRRYRIRVIDVSDPAHPTQVGECKIDARTGYLYSSNCITVSEDKYVYVVLGENGLRILKFTPLTGVGGSPTESSKPERFSLQQNYPNPFNSETIINYQLPQTAKVTLKVYNLLGQQMRTLVDAHQKPGSYTARWDGRDDQGRELPSGVYLYQLKIDRTNGETSFVESKKMLLIR